MKRVAIVILLAAVSPCGAAAGARADIRPPERAPVGTAARAAAEPLCTAEQSTTWSTAPGGGYTGRLTGRIDCGPWQFDVRTTCEIALVDAAGNVVAHSDDYGYRDLDACVPGAVDVSPQTAAGAVYRARLSASLYMRGPTWLAPTSFCPMVLTETAECSNDDALVPGKDSTIRFE